MELGSASGRGEAELAGFAAEDGGVVQGTHEVGSACALHDGSREVRVDSAVRRNYL